MKRILIFSLAYLPYVGGAEMALREIAERIDRRDIEFHLVTLRFDSAWPKEERMGNMIVHRIGIGRKNARIGATFSPAFYISKIFFIPLAAGAGIRLHKDLRFDAAWAMMAYMMFPIVIMRLCGVRLPYAVTLQEGDTFERTFGRARLRPVMPLLDYGFRRAAVLQAISRFLGTWARRRGFEGPLEIIPNGVDGARFSKDVSLEQKEALRQRYGLSDRDTVLCSVSRLVRKNGIDLAIRALPDLPPALKLLIIGDGPERAALEVLAQELGVRDRVVFAGHVDHAHLPEHLHAADIFIRPSRSEGQGIAFIEAMAAGLPVIAPPVGGITDFLFGASRDPGREATGYIIDPESPPSISAAVREIMDDPLRAHQIAIHAQRTALRDYEWDAIAAAMRSRVFARILP